MTTSCSARLKATILSTVLRKVVRWLDVLLTCKNSSFTRHYQQCIYLYDNSRTRFSPSSITKLRENCGKEFDAHWQCLENHNQQFYSCRKPETTFNQCVFEKLVSCHVIECVDQIRVIRKMMTDKAYDNVGLGEEDSWFPWRTRADPWKEEPRH